MKFEYKTPWNHTGNLEITSRDVKIIGFTLLFLNLLIILRGTPRLYRQVKNLLNLMRLRILYTRRVTLQSYGRFPTGLPEKCEIGPMKYTGDHINYISDVCSFDVSDGKKKC